MALAVCRRTVTRRRRPRHPESTMFIPVSEWFPAFVLTLAVEAPIVAINHGTLN